MPSSHFQSMFCKRLFGVFGAALLTPIFSMAAAPAIQLVEVNGIKAFAPPNGRPFRALGVNHFESATEAPAQITANLRAWGFNAGGSNTPDYLAREFVHPKALNLVNVSRWMSDEQFVYRDVFSEKFQTELTGRIRETCEKHRDFPLLIGYFWNDIPLWSGADRDGPSWIDFMRGLPADAAGRKAWETWCESHPDTPPEEFLGEIATTLYSTAHAAFKRFDPERLILGDKYSESDMPEVVVRAALPFIDVLSVQVTSREFDPAFFEQLYQHYGKPIYISDHVGGFSTPEYPYTITQWTWPSAAEYATYYARYISAAMAHPRVVGYIRCQYQSISRKGRLDTQKQGLLRIDGSPYSEILPSVTRANLKAMAAFEAAVSTL